MIYFRLVDSDEVGARKLRLREMMLTELKLDW